MIGKNVTDICNDNPDQCNVSLTKGGKQKIDNDLVRDILYNPPPDICDYLRGLKRGLTNSREDKKMKREIKQAEKRFNCDGKSRF